MRRVWFPLVLALALLLAAPQVVLAGGETDSQAILKELKALKAKLAEMEGLKAKVQELEARLAKSEKASAEAKTLAGKADKKSDSLSGKLAAATKFKVGAALTFNYRNTDYTTSQKSKGGDGVFDTFRINVDGSYNNLILSAQYRWYGYMDVIHHGWIGYNFNENWQGQLGITQVPFGILPYASHNWWFSLAYYVGLEDDYDMGAKLVYDAKPWNLQLAFFKNPEYGSSSRTERYSFDILTSGDQQNEETNTVNARLAYTLKHGDLGSTELGVSGMIGQLYNNTTDSMGSRWAAAAHLNGNYGPFNLMLEAVRYSYDPDNPAGVSDNTVLGGFFGTTYPIAAEANLYLAGLAYTVPVKWGPITSIQFYNDYSVLTKDEDGFNDSHINTLGFLISANPVYVYVDWVMGKNAIWVGGANDPMAMGEDDADWHNLFNINFGYYF